MLSHLKGQSLRVHSGAANWYLTRRSFSSFISWFASAEAYHLAVSASIFWDLKTGAPAVYQVLSREVFCICIADPKKTFWYRNCCNHCRTKDTMLRSACCLVLEMFLFPKLAWAILTTLNSDHERRFTILWWHILGLHMLVRQMSL